MHSSQLCAQKRLRRSLIPFLLHTWHGMAWWMPCLSSWCSCTMAESQVVMILRHLLHFNLIRLIPDIRMECKYRPCWQACSCTLGLCLASAHSLPAEPGLRLHTTRCLKMQHWGSTLRHFCGKCSLSLRALARAAPRYRQQAVHYVTGGKRRVDNLPDEEQDAETWRQCDIHVFQTLSLGKACAKHNFHLSYSFCARLIG